MAPPAPPHPPHPPHGPVPPAPPSPPSPARSGWSEAGARLRRAGVLALGLLVLAWAWNVSGLNEAGKLWANRQRAVDYVLGQPVDATTLEARRAEARREVRTETQTRARGEIEAELRAAGQPVPSLMTLMALAEQRAQAEMDRLGPAAVDALVEERLKAEGLHGGRRGGYFPPETDPRAIFGDPDRLGRLGWPASAVVRAADEAGPAVARPVRWTVSAVAGDGYTGELLETIAIAVWGTLLAVVVAMPAGILGSTRTLEIMLPGQAAWHRAARGSIKFWMRRSFDVARGFNEIVLAMIFVAVLGLGPLPGVLALFIHTYGVLGKVFSEAMETADPKPIEGVQSTGASWSQVVCFAVLPQIMPYIASQSLLRFESNVRGATILGVVGAGGIGQLLMDKFGAFEFQEVATMMIIIIVVVSLIDFACGRLMRSLA